MDGYFCHKGIRSTCNYKAEPRSFSGIAHPQRYFCAHSSSTDRSVRLDCCSSSEMNLLLILARSENTSHFPFRAFSSAPPLCVLFVCCVLHDARDVFCALACCPHLNSTPPFLPVMAGVSLPRSEAHLANWVIDAAIFWNHRLLCTTSFDLNIPVPSEISLCVGVLFFLFLAGILV